MSDIENVLKEADEYIRACDKFDIDQEEEAIIKALADEVRRLQGKLPCDVRVGHITFRSGVSIETFFNAARSWYKDAKKINSINIREDIASAIQSKNSPDPMPWEKVKVKTQYLEMADAVLEKIKEEK